MYGFRKLTVEETEAVHEAVSSTIRTCVDDKNPSICAAPFHEAHAGQESLSVEIKNVNDISLTRLNKSIATQFPGSDIRVETMPNHSTRYMMHLPLWVPVDKNAPPAYEQTLGSAGKPSTEWAMFLFMIDCLAAGALWMVRK